MTLPEAGMLLSGAEALDELGLQGFTSDLGDRSAQRAYAVERGVAMPALEHQVLIASRRAVGRARELGELIQGSLFDLAGAAAAVAIDVVAVVARFEAGARFIVVRGFAAVWVFSAQ
jgi:hypothetical protein